MILVLDNYDSFTYNLVQLAGIFTKDIIVFRNDAVDIETIKGMHPRGIVISPGPGRPEQAGITMDIIRILGSTFPIFGVCLGHQAIGAVFGGTVTYAPELVHGKTSPVRHNGRGIFTGVADPFDAGRYHSLVVARDRLPDELEITAHTDDGLIMAMRHRKFPICGVQFHPESILTPAGKTIFKNWMDSLP